MTNKIILKKSSLQGKIPLAQDLEFGELALNYADGKLYYKNTLTNVVPLYDSVSTATNLAGGTPGSISYQSSTGTTAFIPIGSDGQVLQSNGSVAEWVDNSNFKGDTGYTGSIGYTGSQGITGYTGSQGDLGYTGSAGVIGYTGSAGVIGYTGSAGAIGYTGSAGPGADQDLNTTSSVTFANLTLASGGAITFPDSSVQRRKAPQLYTNADAEAGLTTDDLSPGDFYYDDITESIFIMVGYGILLDLTVRAA